MPKLVPSKPKVVVAKLKRLGFIKDHQTGSHVVMYNAQSAKRAVIPYHLHDLPKGTLSYLLKEAGISVEEFLKA